MAPDIHQMNARSWSILSMYSIRRPTKDHGHDTPTRNKFNIQQEKNTTVKIAVDIILTQENNKLSSEAEAHENIESDLDDNDIYRICNMSLCDKK